MKGKGIWINIIRQCEGPYDEPRLEEIVAKSVNAGFDHVLVKIVSGNSGYNIWHGRDLAAELIEELLAEGIDVWGWGDLYPQLIPAQIIRVKQRYEEIPGMSGFIVDAEAAWKGFYGQAVQLMDLLCNWASAERLQLGVTTYRYPSLHPRFPFEEFHNRAEMTIPQVYWEEAHNPGGQLDQTLHEYMEELINVDDIIPAGSAYAKDGWAATPEDLERFAQRAQEHELRGINFWDWTNMKENKDLWHTIRDMKYNVPGVEPEPDPEPELPTNDEILAEMRGVEWGIRTLQARYAQLEKKLQ